MTGHDYPTGANVSRHCSCFQFSLLFLCCGAGPLGVGYSRHSRRSFDHSSAGKESCVTNVMTSSQFRQYFESAGRQKRGGRESEREIEAKAMRRCWSRRPAGRPAGRPGCLGPRVLWRPMASGAWQAGRGIQGPGPLFGDRRLCVLCERQGAWQL